MGSDSVDLVRTLPGISLNDPTVSASSLNNRATNVMVAGVSAANVQVQRDGVDATQGVRWPTGISSATVINPDLVGEVRMILAAVDAEVGRGTSQIQFQTRSGTNQFRGAATWNIQNSALNPNTWANKRVSGTPLTPPWTNLNEATLSVGGPIVKNKTFFFALWNGLFPETRNLTNPTVLTPCAAARHLPVLRRLEQRQRASGPDRRRHADDRRGRSVGKSRRRRKRIRTARRLPERFVMPACSVPS